MRIYDISQEVFSCTVYPGDPRPEAEALSRMEAGELYNLTAFSMCAHNGTHVDAPFHFIGDGKTIDRLPLEAFVGPCYLARPTGDPDAAAAEEMAAQARAQGCGKLLIAGDVVVTAEAARVFAEAGFDLIGVESASVGPVDAPMEVHLLLLRREIVLLEGLVLADIPEGRYFLNAAPLNLAGADGAPCRAWLMEL